MDTKHRKTLGPLEAILNKIGGDNGVDLLLADKLVLVDPTRGRRSFKAESNPLFTFAGTFKSLGASEFVVAKKFVDVALVEVELSAVKFCRVVEPVARIEAAVSVPDSVGDADNTMLPVPVTALASVTPP